MAECRVCKEKLDGEYPWNRDPICLLCKEKEEEREKKRIAEMEEAFNGKLITRRIKPVQYTQLYKLSAERVHEAIPGYQWRHPDIAKWIGNINKIQRLLKLDRTEKLIEILDVSDFASGTKILFSTHYPAADPCYLIARQFYWSIKDPKTEQAEWDLPRSDSRYKEYLLSEDWTKKRSVILERDEYACRVCNSTTGLQVHHKTYDNIYQEPLGDLITLCKSCHELFHKESN